MRFLLIALVAIGITPDVMAQANLHDAPASYEGLLDLIRNSANQWSGHLRGYATTLFWMLTAISLIWTFGQLVLRQAEFGEIAGELFKFIIVTGFFYAMLLYSVEFASSIVNSFRQAGAAAAGVGMGLRPGDMFGLGVELAQTLTYPTINPALMFHSALSGLIVLLCFAFIAAFIGITLIEAYVVINASVLLMGFGGSQWTREYAVSMLRGSLAIGVKLFVLTLIVGLIMTSARDWQRSFTQDDASTFTILGLALVSAYMCKSVPDLMASLISGISPGGGGVLGGMAAAGMAFGAGAMAALHSSGVLSGAGSALGSVSDLLKGSGSGTSPGGGSGAGSGGTSFMNSMNGGGSSSGASTGPGPRVGGGGHSSAPSPGPAPSAPSGSPSSTTPSSGGSTPKSGGMAAAHMAADAVVRTAGIATSIAVPGAESASSISVGPPPTPPDLNSFSDSLGETPGNVIRPATDIPVADAPTEPPSIDTMASLQEALNNRGKP